MQSLIKNFANDQSGATSIEYAMIATGICVAIVTVVEALSVKTAGSFSAAALAFQ